MPKSQITNTKFQINFKIQMTKYSIKVIPKSSRTEIVELKDDFLKIKLKAVPEKGKANTELIKFLSKYFKTAKSNITIIKGKTGRNKIAEIT